MNKYIVKNCPCITGDECNSYYDDEPFCQDCTDCIIKQVIEKCKRTLSKNKGFEREFTLGKMTFAEFILKDFDIEEVE